MTAYLKKQLDTFRFGRAELRSFLLKYHDLEITEVIAIEGILYCRGENLENSDHFS